MEDSIVDITLQNLLTLPMSHGLMLRELHQQVCKTFVLVSNALFQMLFVLWKEYIELVMYIEGQEEDALLLSCTVKLTNERHDIINLIVQKAQRILAHNTKNDVSPVAVLTQDSPIRNCFLCSICKRKPFFFAQSCGICISNLTTFCISHFTDAKFVYNVPSYRSSIYL